MCAFFQADFCSGITRAFRNINARWAVLQITLTGYTRLYVVLGEKAFSKDAAIVSLILPVEKAEEGFLVHAPAASNDTVPTETVAGKLISDVLSNEPTNRREKFTSASVHRRAKDR